MGTIPDQTCEYTDRQWVDLLHARPQPRTAVQEQAHQQAIECLWREVWKYCLSTATKLGLDEQDVQEAAGNAYAKIRGAVDKDQYKQDGHFLNWCKPTAVHCVYDQWRKHKPQREHEMLLPPDLPSPTPEPSINRNKLRQLLQPCIDPLPAKRRKLLYCLWPWLLEDGKVEERTPEEVVAYYAAQGEHITRNNVNVTSFNIRQALLACLRKRGLDFGDLWDSVTAP